jgi:hypothetical protein
MSIKIQTKTAQKIYQARYQKGGGGCKGTSSKTFRSQLYRERRETPGFEPKTRRSSGLLPAN